MISSSYTPKHSVSIKYAGNGDALFLFVIIRGLDQSQIPLVQSFMVGLRSKPFKDFLSIRTLFNKNDFPGWYFP